jgi:hypothetical protein
MKQTWLNEVKIYESPVTRHHSPVTAPEEPHGRPARKFLRHRIAESILACLRAADEYGWADHARV